MNTNQAEEKYVLITGCSDREYWYNAHKNQILALVSETDCYEVKKLDSRYSRFVHKEHAQLVTLHYKDGYVYAVGDRIATEGWRLTKTGAIVFYSGVDPKSTDMAVEASDHFALICDGVPQISGPIPSPRGKDDGGQEEQWKDYPETLPVSDRRYSIQVYNGTAKIETTGLWDRLQQRFIFPLPHNTGQWSVMAWREVSASKSQPAPSVEQPYCRHTVPAADFLTRAGRYAHDTEEYWKGCEKKTIAFHAYLQGLKDKSPAPANPQPVKMEVEIECDKIADTPLYLAKCVGGEVGSPGCIAYGDYEKEARDRLAGILYRKGFAVKGYPVLYTKPTLSTEDMHTLKETQLWRIWNAGYEYCSDRQNVELPPYKSFKAFIKALSLNNQTK